jgi:hypothetical protein
MTSSPSSGPQNAQEIQFDSVTSRSRYVPGARFYRNVAIYRSRRRDASVRRCLRRIDVTGGAEERNTRSSDSFGVIAMVLITGKCSRHFHSCLHDLPISQQFSILQRLFNYPSEQRQIFPNNSNITTSLALACSFVRRGESLRESVIVEITSLDILVWSWKQSFQTLNQIKI